MSDHDEESKLNVDDSLESISLEEPNVVESADASIGSFFNEDMSLVVTKLAVYESLFKLITSDLKFQDFIREVLLVFMRAVKCEAASVLEVNYQDNTIFFRAAAGRVSEKIVKFVIPLGHGIVGHVVEARLPVVVSNVGENQIHLKAITKSLGFDARNLIALPLIIRGKVFGVIELLNRVGEDTFTKDDQELLESLCQVASKAIEARLMIAWGKNPKSRRAA